MLYCTISPVLSGLMFFLWQPLRGYPGNELGKLSGLFPTAEFNFNGASERIIPYPRYIQKQRIRKKNGIAQKKPPCMKYKTAVHKNIIFHFMLLSVLLKGKHVIQLPFVLFYHRDIVSVGKSNAY
jgi:hypothetical protein